MRVARMHHPGHHYTAMTRLERKLLLINGLLGTGLTLLVLLLDWGGQLQALERWFYDRRALYCQLFTPPPTDRLVYLDIDDYSLEIIERWPWKRRAISTRPSSGTARQSATSGRFSTASPRSPSSGSS